MSWKLTSKIYYEWADQIMNVSWINVNDYLKLSTWLLHNIFLATNWKINNYYLRDRRGFTTTCVISADHHYGCEFEPRVSDATLCNKDCQWLATGWWFSPGTPVSFTNKTDHNAITEILLKVALNTKSQPIKYFLTFNLKQ